MQDLNDKVTGGTLTADEWNEVPSEIQNVIEALGITLSSGDLNQLGKAIAGYVSSGSYYSSSGTNNNYNLTKIGSKQAPTKYEDGFKARFKVHAPNTSSAGANVNGLGLKSIKKNGGGNLLAGDLVSGKIVEIVYNASSDRFELVNDGVESQPISYATTDVAGIVEIATQAEVDAGYDSVRMVSPATLTSKLPFSISSITPGPRVADVIYTNTTGKPLQVNINVRNISGGGALGAQFKIQGVTAFNLASPPNSAEVGICTIVPPNKTYELSLSGTNWILFWWGELEG